MVEMFPQSAIHMGRQRMVLVSRCLAELEVSKDWMTVHVEPETLLEHIGHYSRDGLLADSSDH